MPTVTYRFDYLNLILDTPVGTFNQYYNALSAEGKRVCGGQEKWDKSHKVQALHTMRGEWERTKVDVWGEAADLIRALPWHVWSQFIKRLDVRAILWDVEEDAVLYTGQRLQRNVSSLNVEVFSSKPASKRLGRDRGGKGFRIGSRKSDVCVVVYKRTREPAAQEFRFQGQALRNIIAAIDEDKSSLDNVIDLWALASSECVTRGNRRMERALNEAGIGTYWPLFDHLQDKDYEALQTSFQTYVQTVERDEHDAANWADLDKCQICLGESCNCPLDA